MQILDKKSRDLRKLAPNMYHWSIRCLRKVKHSSMRSFFPLDLKQKKGAIKHLETKKKFLYDFRQPEADHSMLQK